MIFVALIRFLSLCKKETLQIIRDPSTLLIAFLFPVVLMMVFGAGINLDSSVVKLGIFSQDSGAPAGRLVANFKGNPNFDVTETLHKKVLEDQLRAGEIQGFVVIRDDFSRSFTKGSDGLSRLQIVTDGAEPNNANFVAVYSQTVIASWIQQERSARGLAPTSGFRVETRTWFNPSSVSRNFLLPGSITIIMTVVGALLTSLVIAREWERGTMEALLAAGVGRFELILSKLVPYFFLGLAAFGICVAMTHFIFHVPLRGSLFMLTLVGSAFLLSALGLGLLLSTALRSQYNAAQAALNIAFLPALMLSGFVFEIASMPAPIRAVTRIIPARYFVTAMQTLFQSGDITAVLSRSMLGLTLASIGFIGLALIKTRRRLS